MIKRIKLDNQKPAFWVKKRGGSFVAYRSFVKAVLGIASPGLGSLIDYESVKRVYGRKRH